jgi:hypothetical protein
MSVCFSCKEIRNKHNRIQAEREKEKEENEKDENQ